MPARAWVRLSQIVADGVEKLNAMFQCPRGLGFDYHNDAIVAEAAAKLNAMTGFNAREGLGSIITGGPLWSHRGRGPRPGFNAREGLGSIITQRGKASERGGNFLGASFNAREGLGSIITLDRRFIRHEEVSRVLALGLKVSMPARAWVRLSQNPIGDCPPPRWLSFNAREGLGSIITG